MKTLLTLVCMAQILGANESPKLAELVTADGKVYHQVTIRKVEPDGLSILHEAGANKVPFEKLPEAMQREYGYDPAAAGAHRQAQQAAAAQAEAAMAAEEAAQAAKRSATASASRKADADKELRDRVRGMVRQVMVEGYQISDIGVLANMRVLVRKKGDWFIESKADGVMRHAKGVEAGEVVNFHPNGIKPTTGIRISWEGPAWRIGSVQYKTQMGLLRTCPLFTASEDEAVEFFRKHGFTKAAVDAVRVER